MYYKINFFCNSHIGNVRRINQDNFICNDHYMEIDHIGIEFPLNGQVTSKTPSLFGVFDGMGGEECGEIAAYIAAKEASIEPLKKDGVSALIEYCTRANEKICKYAEDNSISAMGTTAAMLLLSKRQITLCNIGDSKIFHFSNDQMEQISKDHVAISAFGTKPPLSQNLGIPPEELLIEPYVSRGKYKIGDKYLICSDGLTDMVSIDEIAETLQQVQSKNILEILLNKALGNGGRDNITMILLEIQK